MGKKNIKPSINQPVIRQNVAKPALEGLTEENLTGTARGAEGGVASQGSPEAYAQYMLMCSYDGDDAE